MKKIKCKSGIFGWQARLHKVYSSLENFESFCKYYNIHGRLGYKSPKTAWRANPLIEGSIEPSDLRKSKV